MKYAIIVKILFFPKLSRNRLKVFSFPGLRALFECQHHAADCFESRGPLLLHPQLDPAGAQPLTHDM